MRRISSALSALSVAAAMTAACAEESTSAAEAAAGAHYEYREKVMESIGANMGAIGDIMKNKLPHQANIAVHARTIQLAAGLIESAFQEKVVTGESLPTVWEKWDEFAAAAKATEEARGNLAAAAATGDMAATGQAVRALGKTCGSCHKVFREKKE